MTNVAVVHALVRGAGADLQIDRIDGTAVDQAVADAASGLEPRGISGLENRFPLVLLQYQLTFQHVDELVLLLVPVPQCRPRARLDARDVDTELSEPDRVAEPLLLAPGDRRRNCFG